jgi:molybdenum cofactor cytidylyltransferase
MTDDRGVGAVILAAGASRRYGSPKQLAMIDGRTMLEHVIGTALTAELDPVVVVAPAWMSAPAAIVDPRLRWIRNAFPERGMSLSVRLGLGAVGPAAPAALILLGDQPGVQPSTIAAVLGTARGRPIVAAVADGVLAPPVLIERSHFYLADDLSGDVGLRDLLRRHPDLVTGVPVPAHAADLDTADDLGLMTGP